MTGFLIGCSPGTEECGTFLVKDTFELNLNKTKEVYKYCNGQILNVEMYGIWENSDTVGSKYPGALFWLTPYKQDAVRMSLGDSVLIDERDNEQVSHGQFLEGYKRYIKLISIDQEHELKAMFKVVNEH